MSERDAKSYLAPILLIPIQIRRKSVAEGFRISRLDEDTMINETLLELLRSQFRKGGLLVRKLLSPHQFLVGESVKNRIVGNAHRATTP